MSGHRQQIRDLMNAADARAASPSASANKKGDRAEAGRPRNIDMLNIEPRVQEGKTKATGEAPKTIPTAVYSQTEKERAVRLIDDRVERSRREEFSEVITLTPALAQVLLDRNDANRPISKDTVRNYSRDIATGRWEFNGEAIVVSEDGRLNDGQHRCAAVLDCLRSIRTVIVFGPRRETRFTLDQGLVRTTAHFLGMKGVEGGRKIAAVASWIWQYKTIERLSNNGNERGTKSEILLVFESYPDIFDHIEAVQSRSAGGLQPHSVTAFCRWAICQRAAHLSDVDRFFEKLVLGHSLAAGDPVLSARNRLLQMRGKQNPGERAEIIFRAWNLHRRGNHTTRGIPLSGGKLPKLER